MPRRKGPVAAQVLRGLERARGNPSLRTLEKIATVFDTSVASLLGGERAPDGPALFDSATLVALNVKRLRRSRSWSAEDVQDRIMMKAAYVSFIETGKQGCTLQTLQRLARGFNVDVAEFLAPPGPTIRTHRRGGRADGP